MSAAWAICKREVVSFFVTPVGYVVLAAYALISGLGFTASFFYYRLMTESPTTFGYKAVPDFEETFLSPFVVFCGMLMMFIGPLISMRLFSEERNQGTIELLFTHPLRDREIIAGKYGASLVMLLAMMAVTGVYLVLIAAVVDHVEPSVLWFGLLTTLLMGAAFLSLGLFVSAVCTNQITAATATFGAFFVFYILGAIAGDFPENNPAPLAWPDQVREPLGVVYGIVRSFVRELPLDTHARDMAQGIVQPYDIAYYLLFSAFFLFLTFRALEGRKWRG